MEHIGRGLGSGSLVILQTYSGFVLTCSWVIIKYLSFILQTSQTLLYCYIVKLLNWKLVMDQKKGGATHAVQWLVNRIFTSVRQGDKKKKQNTVTARYFWQRQNLLAHCTTLCRAAMMSQSLRSCHQWWVVCDRISCKERLFNKNEPTWFHLSVLSRSSLLFVLPHSTPTHC